jgi:ubiquinone/menaquinone biosynthesis C-methylase UbiE
MPDVKENYQAVVREYRDLSERYDQKWAFYIEATVRETLRRLPTDLGSDILDVACGTGAILQAVREAYPDVRFSGIDVSPEMLAVARKRLPDDTELKVASADALPFRDASFDTIVTTNAFHFFRLPNRALQEMHRVLRPGGRLIVTDWCDDYLSCRICDRILRAFNSAHYNTYSSVELREILESTHFEDVNLERYKINWLWGMMTAIASKSKLMP